MNRDMMLKVADYLDALPASKFAMTEWLGVRSSEIGSDMHSTKNIFNGRSIYSLNIAEADCDTCGCIAGWVVLLQNGVASSDTHYNDIAGKALGLTYEEARELFHGQAPMGRPSAWSRYWKELIRDDQLINDVKLPELDNITHRMAARMLRRLATNEWQLTATIDAEKEASHV